MALTVRDQQVLNEIKHWEQMLNSYVANDIESTIEKYMERAFSILPEETQQKFFQTVDIWLFHLHALLQGAHIQDDARRRIIEAGRAFNENLQTIDDLKLLSIDQLKYIANQHIARHRLYSFTQGGLAGTGETLLLGTDMAAVTIINLRVVQLIATTYGYEVNNPYEMMTSLKVFQAATLPERMKGKGWALLVNELEEAEDYYFYAGDDQVTELSWLEQPLKQILKAVTIVLCRNKTMRGIPIISMAIGAGMNYQLTRDVSDFAHKYYQWRYCFEKERQR